MKRYLWLVIGLFCLHANASLKDAFAQIEEEEGMLLQSLTNPAPSNKEKQIVATPKENKQEAMLAKQKAKERQAKQEREALEAYEKQRAKKLAKVKQEQKLAQTNLTNKVDDIDLEQEARDRKKAADEAYARAVEEMSQEY